MTKRPSTLQRVRTAAALKADAVLLAGDQSRVAKADTGDSADAPAPDTGSVGELWLYGVVGGWWFGFSAETVSNALRGLDVDTLYVRIHSPGGSAPDGVAIGNLLRNHKAHVVVVVDGLAASAASVIAIAGDEVVMCPGSQMMLHDASCLTYGNEAQLHRDADWIGKQSLNYAGVYAHKAGGTAEHWRNDVMLANDGEGTWYTADEAVTAKLADTVGTRVAAGSPPVAPKDEFDETDEEMLVSIEHDLAILEHEVHPAALAAWTGAPPSSRTSKSRAHLKPPSASAVGSTHTQGGSAVAFSDEQLTTMRAELGLPETADEAAIVTAVKAVVEDSLEDRPTNPPAGMTLVSTEVLDELRAGAQAGREAQTALQNADRDRTIQAALREGKISAAQANGKDGEPGHFAKLWDADPEGTRALLASLAPGLVPVSENGHDNPTDELTSEEDAAYAGVWPEDVQTQKGA